MPRPARTRTTPRTAASLAAALATTLTLGACAPGPSTETASAPAASGTGTFPVVIDHAYGTTEIPAEPTRIVTLGLSDQEPLLALGVAPVAVSEWYGGYDHATWPWAQDELGGAEPVVLNGGERDESNPPLEEVAALEPDLILSLYNGTTKEQYDELSKIAPTVVPDEEYANFAITWQEATRATGEALGREDEALGLVAGLEQAFEDAAADHPEFVGQEVVVAERFEPGQSIVRSGNDVRARFFEQLGFEVPSEIAGATANEYGEITVSDERMAELSKDLLVWNVGDAPERRAEIEDLALFGTLPVVTEDRVLWVDDPEVSGAFTWGTVLSLQFALDELLPQVADVVG
ncbi:iron-siderophore ABC transporter substrate-binding protein [Cellulosimicrobium sp. NPDC057862]|uniref:iron-siderophore ABC transporter substrate-binding protein n=1 Tax=Cellulosimicrobium sp. NPDC057862 TaxID=3346266 RepID=UPI0036731C87